jgi:hypothetical protein
VNFSPPKDYPIEHPPEGNVLPPIKLIYSVMKYALTTAHNESFTGTWNKKNIGSFLKVHNLTYQELLVRKQAAPENFNMWKVPDLWDR